MREADGKSKNYGFVTFRNLQDAEQAMIQMSGEWLGKRAMRVNFAHSALKEEENRALEGAFTNDASIVSAQTDPSNVTVYVGGVPPGTTDWQLRQAFEDIGRITGVRLHDGFAFVEFSTHDEAVNCIIQKNGSLLAGKLVKISWSKSSK